MIKVNGQEVPFFTFPGGEVSVNIKDIKILSPPEMPIFVRSDIYTSDDIMKLVMTISALREGGWSDRNISLHIPYFPYARQDRICSEGEGFGLKAMCEIINSLGCEEVIVSDPHSKIIRKYLKNISVIHKSHYLQNLLEWDYIMRGLYFIVSPDAGAAENIKEFSGKFNGLKIFSATKVRNKETGAIEQSIFNDDVKGLNLIIVDDICDGGDTFINLSKILKQKGANKLILYVTHGIFSKGVEHVAAHFDKIECQFFFPGKQQEYDEYENKRAACN